MNKAPYPVLSRPAYPHAHHKCSLLEIVVRLELEHKTQFKIGAYRAGRISRWNE